MNAGRDTDRDWARIAETEPYFGVMSDPRYLSTRMDDAARRAFFEVGEDHIRDMFSRLQPLLNGRRIGAGLDFGCGVGRLLLPMSRFCRTVAGVDIGPAMRIHAMQNAAAAGAGNISVHESIEALPEGARYDWINSYIVFQHIPPARGQALLELLLGRLAVGGVFSLHFTIARDRSLLHATTGQIGLHRIADGLLHALELPEPVSTPVMSMYDYDLNTLMTTLYRHGIDDVMVHHGIDGGHYSVILLGQRRHARRIGLLRPGQTLRFNADGATNLLLAGFAQPEGWGVWTIGEQAEIELPVATDQAAELLFEGSGYTPSGGPPQEIRVSVNGEQTAVWHAMRGQVASFALPVPPIAPDAPPLRIRFDIASPCAPADCGEGNDFRRLGFGLRSVRIADRGE